MVSVDRTLKILCRSYSGGYSGGVPPLPIPNREVKPVCADGTAHPRESRLPPFLAEALREQSRRAFCVCIGSPREVKAGRQLNWEFGSNRKNRYSLVFLDNFSQF